METTIVIALITAIAAIVAPIITAIINSHSLTRIKTIEQEGERLRSIDLHERAVLESALSGLGNLMSFADKECFQESCRSILMAAAYVDKTTSQKLIQIVHGCRESEKKLSVEEYTDVCLEIKKEINKRIR